MGQALELPMQAFEIKGFDGSVSLEIGEVFGFPEEVSYRSGYGARGQLCIRAGSYRVAALHDFTIGELLSFREALAACYASLSGEARLENMEAELEMTCAFDRTGHVTLTGTFQENPVCGNKLAFEIELDQTFIPDVLAQLRCVARVFCADGTFPGPRRRMKRARCGRQTA